MLEGIKTALKDYYDIGTDAEKGLKSKIETIKKEYVDSGTKYAEKLGEAQEVYNSVLRESKEKYYNICVSILDTVYDHIKKVIETPVPVDFVSTFEAFKTIKNFTPRERESIINTYKNNYYAYRAICDFLKITPKPLTIDDIYKEIEYLKSNIHTCFYSDNLNGYHFHNWMDGKIIARLDEVFKAFCESRFEDATKDEDDPNGIQN